MLRVLFDEPPREGDGRLRDIFELLEDLGANFRAMRGGERSLRGQRLLAWTKSLAGTLDELEQSVYCAAKYAELVHADYVEEMTAEEREQYRRHLYFYKNGFIRVFSVLDKLGSFLDEWLELGTAQVKERFSYFTVLRRMRERRSHPELQRRLDAIKREWVEPMNDLRLMRNHEVHAINTELLDDEGRLRLRAREPRLPVEDLRQNVRTLLGGYAMACESLFAALDYMKRKG